MATALLPLSLWLVALVALFIVAFVVFGLALKYFLGVPATSSGRPFISNLIQRGITRDRYGIRTGSIDDAGVVRDRYGRREGSIDDSGVVRDRYGRREGSIEDSGVVRDRYGRREGSIDDSGVVRDRYGRREGSIDG